MLIVLGGRTALSCYQLEFVGNSDICDSVPVGGRVCVWGLEGGVEPTWALFLTVRIVTLTVGHTHLVVLPKLQASVPLLICSVVVS